MFGLDLTMLLIILLAAVSAASVAYALLFSRMETEKKAGARLTRVKAAESDTGKAKAARDRAQELSKRRKTLQDSLKDLEKKQEEKNKYIGDKSLKSRIAQTGLSLTMGRFYAMSVGLGFLAFLAALIIGMPLLASLGAGFVFAFGLPRWIIGFLIKRRRNKFLEEFPNALDVMVRSIKSGLPLNDAIRLIASDGREPVKREFQRVIEAQKIGMSVPDACARMLQTMPLSEVSFFAIVIAIQSQAGGNLSEALGNLAKVLRERRKMKAKVSALSMEAKASAVIIGALPFIVATLVYLTSPQYMMVLFTDPRGHIIMMVSGVWMTIGVVVMRNMVNFEI